MHLNPRLARRHRLAALTFGQDPRAGQGRRERHSHQVSTTVAAIAIKDAMILKSGNIT
jgi:hypothetical protein